MGAGMNQSVFIANGGKFPVMINERHAESFGHEGEFFDDLHCFMTNKTHLNFLADYINLHTTIKSPGDLLVELGDFLAGYSLAIWMTVVVMELNRRIPTQT